MTIEAGPEELYTTRARTADVPALIDLINGAYCGAPGGRGWTSEAGLADGPRIDAAALAAMIGSADHTLLVQRAAAGVFACAGLRARPPASAELVLLAVRPALQGNRLGRQMLAAAERYAREQLGAAMLELAVPLERDELLAWLERRGYQQRVGAAAAAPGRAIMERRIGAL